MVSYPDGLIEGNWQFGFQVCPENCDEVRTWDPACRPGGPTQKPMPAANRPCYEVDPFQLIATFECGSHGWTSQDYPGRARRLLEAGLSKALEYELWTGAQKPGNFHLTGPTSTVLNGGNSVSALTALRWLGQALAGCGTGARGMIHAPTFLVDTWIDQTPMVKEDGTRLVTVNRGDIIISGSGYDGSGPGGIPAPPGKTWAYATGLVQKKLDDVEIIPGTLGEALNRATNTITFRAERLAVAWGDPCCHFAILVDLPDFCPDCVR